ncbi:MAG: hypothetical protein ACK46Q_10730 [Hyphomonas sp.]
MTQSLTERLQARHATQMAEIEALTSAELKKLAENLMRVSEAELISTHDAIREMNARWNSQLETVNAIARWWWMALIVTWLMVGVLSVWHSWTKSPSTAGIGLYQTFTHEGRSYLMLPEGTEPMVCRQGEKRMPCVALPVEH